MDGDAALQNIAVARAGNSEHQMQLIDAIAAKMAEDGSYRLLIIDSIIALFRVDYSGRGELADRQQKLNYMMSRLCKIAEEFNVVIFITNQMTADPGATMSFVSDPKVSFSQSNLFETNWRPCTSSCKRYSSLSQERAWRTAYCKDL